MKAKKIVSTDKDSKVILEMTTSEASDLFDALTRIRQSFEVNGFETGFYSEEYEVAVAAQYFKTLLGLE